MGWRQEVVGRLESEDHRLEIVRQIILMNRRKGSQAPCGFIWGEKHIQATFWLLHFFWPRVSRKFHIENIYVQDLRLSSDLGWLCWKWYWGEVHRGIPKMWGVFIRWWEHHYPRQWRFSSKSQLWWGLKILYWHHEEENIIENNAIRDNEQNLNINVDLNNSDEIGVNANSNQELEEFKIDVRLNSLKLKTNLLYKISTLRTVPIFFF